jgi:hypothetical protein
VASGDDDYYDHDDDDDDYKNNELRYVGVKESVSVWFRASTYRENLNLLLLTRREESHTLEKILKEVLLGFIIEQIHVYE